MITLFNKNTMKYPTPLELLKHRVAQNYEDFKSEMLCLMDEEEIFDMAHRIAAVRDCFEQITDDGYIGLTDSDACFLLRFHNPLEMVADYLNAPVTEEDVEDALEEVINATGLEEQYIAMSFAEELIAKHGGDMPVKAALLEETIEAGESYLRLLKLVRKIVERDAGEPAPPFKILGFDEDGFFIYEDDGDDGEGCF